MYLIGGAACDIVFENSETAFRATRDLDIVLIVEALTPEFGEKFWNFVQDGKYRNKATNGEKTQFYRFDKPKDESFPKMFELFCRNDFQLREMTGIPPYTLMIRYQVCQQFCLMTIITRCC